MKAIRDATTIMGLLEDGALNADFSRMIAETLSKLRDLAGAKGSAKGAVSLTLRFDVEGYGVTIETDITSKTPKEHRESTFMFLGEDGLTNEHPKQINMFPEDADKRRPRSA